MRRENVFVLPLAIASLETSRVECQAVREILSNINSLAAADTVL